MVGETVMSTDPNLESDLNGRAREILAELSKDGYPELEKLTIVCAALCTMMADGADTMDRLLEVIATFKRMIETGAKMQWSERRGKIVTVSLEIPEDHEEIIEMIRKLKEYKYPYRLPDADAATRSRGGGAAQ
jgi:hypothetical protein